MHKIFHLITLIVLLCGLSCCSNPQPQLKGLAHGDVILAFGDSLTYGTGANLEGGYPQILQRMTGFRVVNAGVPGEETRDGILRLKNELEYYHPQLVILCMGGNDMFRKRPYAEIKENLRKMIQTIKSSGAQVLLISVPEPGIKGTPLFYRELGEEFQLPVEDKLIAYLLRHPEYKSDNIHFNNDGYKVFAQRVAQFLKKQGAL